MAGDELTGRQFVGQRVIHQDVLGQDKGGCTFQHAEHTLGCFGLFGIVEKAFTGFDCKSYLIFVHFIAFC